MQLMPWMSDIEMSKIMEQIPEGYVLVFPLKGKPYLRKKWSGYYKEEY